MAKKTYSLAELLKWKRILSAQLPVKVIAYKPKEPTMAKEFTRTKSCETAAELLRMPDDMPTIVITPIAMLKIHTLVGMTTEEISWLGTVSRDGNVFLIEDIYYLRQTCTGVHTKFPTDSLNELSSKLLALPDGMEIWNKLNFWGHSHGTGSVFASKQDRDQMNLFEENGCEYYIRGIFGWNGNVTFSVYNWKDNIAFHEVEWSASSDEVVDASVATQVKDEAKKWFDENVTIEPETYQYTYQGVCEQESDETAVAYPWIGFDEAENADWEEA